MTKKLLALIMTFVSCVMTFATDMVVKQKNGETFRIDVKNVKEVIFNENDNISDDSTEVNTSEKFLRFKILSDSTAEFIGLRKEAANEVIVPAKVRIDGKVYTVTSIGDAAVDFNNELTSIYIPDGVTNIGAWAFGGCYSLTSINIPDSVTNIGKAAFYNCESLTSIKIPEGVTSIEDMVFYGCSSLASINIPKGVTSIGATAFYGCSELMSIKIPEGVTSIGNNAFSDCSGLISIKIPEGVTNIEDYAFFGCNNLDVVIDNSKDNVNVGEDAFKGCKSVTWSKE